MQAIINFFARLRVFNRLRALEQDLAHVEGNHARLLELLSGRVEAIEDYFESREPCNTCGHHRYKKELHCSGEFRRAPVVPIREGNDVIYDESGIAIGEARPVVEESDIDLDNVPAFLRKQAD